MQQSPHILYCTLWDMPRFEKGFHVLESIFAFLENKNSESNPVDKVIPYKRLLDVWGLSLFFWFVIGMGSIAYRTMRGINEML